MCCCIIGGVIWMCQQGVSSHRGFDIISDRSVDISKARSFLCSIDHKQPRPTWSFGEDGPHLPTNVVRYHFEFESSPIAQFTGREWRLYMGILGGTAHGGWKWRFTPGMVQRGDINCCSIGLWRFVSACPASISQNVVQCRNRGHQA